MRHLTVRNLTPDLAKALGKEQRRGKKSLNQTVIDLLRKALGIAAPGGEFDNGLGKYAGTWTKEQFEEFQKNTAFFNEIDPEMWK